MFSHQMVTHKIAAFRGHRDTSSLHVFVIPILYQRVWSRTESRRRSECKYLQTPISRLAPSNGPLAETREPGCIIHRLKWNCTPMREAKPSGEHTHLTWPSVHAVSTSFGPYKSLHHCRGAYWTSSHLPTDGSRQRGLTMRTVCAETLWWSCARCRPDKDEHEHLLKCFRVPLTCWSSTCEGLNLRSYTQIVCE